ncbi:glycosyltransferase family A protein, partial [Streptomyces griseoincarnatus]
PRVEALLRDTLRSLTAQDHPDFVVFVVGNKEPGFPLPDKVHFIPVDFPPPVLTRGPRTPRDAFVWDKGTKIGIGLLAARAVKPDHVMIVDADDFVHRGLAGFVAQRPDAPGWVLTNGYIYSRARQTYRPQRTFNHVCGTSHVVRYDAYAVPDRLDMHADQTQVAEGYGERLHAILGAHHDALDWLADDGFQLARLPFRGAAYQVDTGENHSGYTLRGASVPVTHRFEETFGVPPRDNHGEPVWRALGPHAAVEHVSDLSQKVLRRLKSTTTPRVPGS